MINKTIHHYKIIEKLGEGGMGVVYKARDTKLDREVALKFLPSNAIASKEEKARFQQEAKAAAKLSHANIAHVYEINEHEGEIFIAMEYIAGETLSDMIEKRPLKIKDVIKIARQIAEGLHAAHEQGIVHRDIKSANVMIKNKGVAKIMDFGLAKSAKGSMVTKAGTTLGTISYMSPEQTQGEKVDHRTDIWSLGVVLYEMISGQMPFKGDYESAIIYSIMNEEPEPLTAVRSGVPMKLEEIVNKLLAKEAGERYQNIVELPVDLKAVQLKETESSRVSSSSISTTMQGEKELTVKVKYSRKNLVTIAAAVFLTFLMTWFLKPGPPQPNPWRPNRVALPIPQGTSFVFPSYANRLAISPDGQDITFVASDIASSIASRLFLKKPESFDIAELASTDQARGPIFSADGRWIGYQTLNGEFYKVSVAGGEPLKIDVPLGVKLGVSWTRDGRLVFADLAGIHLIPEVGQEPTTLTKQAGNLYLAFPSMLPDDTGLLFTVAVSTDLSEWRLAVLHPGDAEYKIILDEEGYNGIYVNTGHILYGRSNRLMAVSFDLKTLSITGAPAPVLENVSTGNRGGMSFAWSDAGTIAYVPGTVSRDRSRSAVTVDLSGKVTRLGLERDFRFARYSPDGASIAFIIGEGSGSNIWIFDTGTSAMNQLTIQGNTINALAWSPDGSSLAYSVVAGDSPSSIVTQHVDGTGTSIVYESAENIFITDWSPDGSAIAFELGMGTAVDLYVYSLQEKNATPYLATEAFEVEMYFSPNGKWVVYEALEGASTTTDIFVRPFPQGTGGVWKISENGGSKATWAPDGRRIYYVIDDALFAVDVMTEGVFSRGNPQRVFPGDYFLPQGRKYDIHPDGDRFIMFQHPQDGPEEQRIYVIQNFDEEIKRLAPVR